MRLSVTSLQRSRVLATVDAFVAITGASFAPDNPAWREAFVRLQERGRGSVFCGDRRHSIYAKHGTQIDTRLLVIDKLPAADPTVFRLRRHGGRRRYLARLGEPACLQGCPSPYHRRSSLSSGRLSRSLGTVAPPHRLLRETPRQKASTLHTKRSSMVAAGRHRLTDALYEGIRIAIDPYSRIVAHPTKLVQSAAMASVASPKPSYRPPACLRRSGGRWSSVGRQLQSVIYAGEAHSEFLSWAPGRSMRPLMLSPPRLDDAECRPLSPRLVLGDGTGAGKGRQVAGFCSTTGSRARRRAVWVNKSDKLIGTRS